MKNVVCLILMCVSCMSYLIGFMIPIEKLEPYFGFILTVALASGTGLIFLLPDVIDAYLDSRKSEHQLIYGYCSYPEYVALVRKYLDNESIVLLGGSEELFTKTSYYGWIQSQLHTPEKLIFEYLNEELQDFVKKYTGKGDLA